MTVDLTRYKRLKRAVDDARREADRAEGEVASILRRLRDDAGCDDEDDARAKLTLLRKREAKTAKAAAAALAAFERDWSERLG